MPSSTRWATSSRSSPCRAPSIPGETPITIRWDYNALSNRDKSAGNPDIGVIIPATGVVAGVYVQAISAYAPHPNAARLWMEFLYSDEGQIIWLKGYGHPVRYADLAARNVIPADVAAKLPPGRVIRQGGIPDHRPADRGKAVHRRQLGHDRERDDQEEVGYS